MVKTGRIYPVVRLCSYVAHVIVNGLLILHCCYQPTGLLTVYGLVEDNHRHMISWRLMTYFHTLQFYIDVGRFPFVLDQLSNGVSHRLLRHHI